MCYFNSTQKKSRSIILIQGLNIYERTLSYIKCRISPITSSRGRHVHVIDCKVLKYTGEVWTSIADIGRGLKFREDEDTHAPTAFYKINKENYKTQNENWNLLSQNMWPEVQV